mgnify:CR=1 FL=1
MDVASSEKVCNYHEVLEYLNLTTDNSLYKLTRPVLDHTHHTTVHLEILLYAILAVVRPSGSSNTELCHAADQY